MKGAVSVGLVTDHGHTVGASTPTDAAIILRARRHVASAALDAADCALLLDMLGLTPVVRPARAGVGTTRHVRRLPDRTVVSKKLGWLHPKADGTTDRDQADPPAHVEAARPGREVEHHRCGLTGGDTCPATGQENCPSC